MMKFNAEDNIPPFLFQCFDILGRRILASACSLLIPAG